jgi:hypothetical protein
MLHIAARENNVIEFDEAPPDRVKTPVMKSVKVEGQPNGFVAS